MRNIGLPELLLVLVVVLLVFGSTRLPKLARSLGASAKQFRKGVDEGVEADNTEEPDA